MRFVRTIFTLLIALGLTLSPVAADLARAHMVKCDHVLLMKDAQPAPDHQLTAVGDDDRGCCKGAAKCPPSTCAAKCASGQAILQGNTVLVNLERTILIAAPLAILHWPSLPPDPPPPRA